MFRPIVLVKRNKIIFILFYSIIVIILVNINLIHKSSNDIINLDKNINNESINLELEENPNIIVADNVEDNNENYYNNDVEFHLNEINENEENNIKNDVLNNVINNDNEENNIDNISNNTDKNTIDDNNNTEDKNGNVDDNNNNIYDENGDKDDISNNTNNEIDNVDKISKTNDEIDNVDDSNNTNNENDDVVDSNNITNNENYNVDDSSNNSNDNNNDYNFNNINNNNDNNENGSKDDNKSKAEINAKEGLSNDVNDKKNESFNNKIINNSVIKNNNIGKIDKNSNIKSDNKIIKENKSENNVNTQRKKTDEEYIEQYKGGELEPEWEWAKSMSIVYTWVDGSDVNFLDVKSKYNSGYKTFNSRDRSADELRYSLRSVEKYMPWHNGTIFIVTSNQIPKWLDTTNPKVKLVYHKDFIPEHYYPTYDSNTIELFLDKIPGITERFLYFNDDIFINNYVHPCFFFTSENYYPKVYRRHKVKLNQKKTDSIINNNSVVEMFHATKFFTRKAIQDYFDPKFEYRYLLHTVYSLYRDLMEPFRELFADELKIVCSDRFRSYYEIQILYVYQSYLYYATKHEKFPIKLGGVGKAEKFIGKSLSSNRTIKKYASEMVPAKIGSKYIHFGSITNNLNKNEKKFTSFKNDTNLLIYNFNDEYNKSDALYQFTQYMITRYPEPTSFEKREFVNLEVKYQPDMNKPYEITDEKIKEYNITEEELKDKYLHEQLYIVRNYLEDMEALTKPQEDISDREKEEIDLLLNYSGDELKEEWYWATDISLVYVLDPINDKCNCTYGLDRLKYSLRSIDKYLTWHKGKIFIIYQDYHQKEEELSWLNTEETRIELVNKKDLLPSEISSTHNKHIIEFYMDKIPGISEKFIYLNDHHYFTHNIHPHFFFDNDYYPKYNLQNPVNRNRERELNRKGEKDELAKTYKLIFDAFHKNYVKTYRNLYDMPCPLYRDLIEPVRQLYQNEWSKFLEDDQNEENVINILPIYLLITYNIYGAAQPFYPDYVAGYGMIRNATIPILNNKRTIQYYGFDITSVLVNEATILPELIYKPKDFSKSKEIKELLNSKKIFFSINYKNQMNFMQKLDDELSELLYSLYNEKSTFEN